MFARILIANRGEIACRIIATCRRLGIETVAVYSAVDRHARHVRLADRAFEVGAAPARESYLNIPAILDAARASGAEAVHPGYGFLSENAQFAERCAASGIVFIGPPVAAIRAMGSKSAAKALMAKAGVPLVPGYHGETQDPALLAREAERIGFPVLIKASAGGGGKGMRVVESAAGFAEALAACQREGERSFGDARVLLEKFLPRARHLEIQVFADTHGHVLSLHERDCSAQRRHQKVIEEAPAPGVDEALRARMGEAACAAARAVGYVGAGTVEFIAEPGGPFYFMEMNTRLQVEHPVTEFITGLDLVAWQLRVAGGEPLPLLQVPAPRGHAIEARIYAEDPARGFLPSIGRLDLFCPPAETAHVRVDSGVEQGDEVSPYYDPMLAKLIVWDETRTAALARLRRALGEFHVAGVTTNVPFLERLISEPVFQNGAIDTTYIERAGERLWADGEPGPECYAAAALWQLELEAQMAAQSHSPWVRLIGWRLNGSFERTMRFARGEAVREVSVRYGTEGILIDGVRSALQHSGAGRRLQWGEQSLPVRIDSRGTRLDVFCGARHAVLALVDTLALAEQEPDAHGGLDAPMPGLIIRLLCEPGARVERGAPLLVMEAMKMEHTLRAPSAGCVRAWRCQVGEQVSEGAQLVDFESDA